MGNARTDIDFLRNGVRFPKVEVTPVSVPTVQVTKEEWNRAVNVLDTQEKRFDNLGILFLSDGIEEVDVEVAEYANQVVKALYFSATRQARHRYALKYLYHWGTDDFQVTIVDYNEASGTETNVVSGYHFKGDKLEDLKDGNGNVIGKIYASTSDYTNVIATGGAATTRMPYCNNTCWQYNQNMIVNARFNQIDSEAASVANDLAGVKAVIAPTLLGTDGTEASDVVKCNAANVEVKGLFLSQKPSSGHRYVLTYLYLQTSDMLWFFSIADLNISANTTTNVVSNHRAADKTVCPIIANNTEIGLILLDSTHYTLIGDQGEGAARLPWLTSAAYDKLSQSVFLTNEVETTSTVARSAQRKATELEDSLFPTLFATAGTEASDVVKCAAANEEVKALYLSRTPASGHRFVLTSLFLQTSDYTWYYNIEDLNVSAGTSTLVVNHCKAEDKIMDVVKDANGDAIGYVFFDSDKYVLIANQGEGAARLPYLTESCFDMTSQIDLFKSAVNSRLQALEHDAAFKQITIWGDSITWGSASTAKSKCYASLLQTWLTNAGYSHKVVNCGVGGDNMPTILGRMGATMLYLTKNLTIPASASSSAEVDTVSNYVQVGKYLKAACKPTEQIQLMMQGDLGRSHIDDPEKDLCHTVNPVVVNGVECVWAWEPVAEGRVDEGSFTLAVKETQSADVVLKAGSPIYPHGAKIRSDVAVFAMGTNGGFTDATDYVAMVEAAVMTLGTGKFIVCSPYGGTALNQQGVEGLEAVEAALMAKYGAKFFNWRKYLVEEGLSVEGLTATSADSTAIAQGKCPPSLLADEVHPNDYGHDAIAKRLYQMMDALGYFE